ncbi:hypothetical protein DITRI_Ditri15bG0086700 [Diplodiscus trichospermus]
MGNEMGNNNTSGLREEDNTAQDKSQREGAHADAPQGQNHVVPATLDKDSQEKETGLVSNDVGREDPINNDQKTDDKGEDDMKTEGTKSLQDVAPTDDDKGPNHEVVASEDIHINEKETGLASINLEEVPELNNDNQKQFEREQDYNTIPEAKEKSLQETAHADGAKEQHLSVPAADDENTHGNETYLVSNEPDGTVSPNVDNQKQDEKGEDDMKTEGMKSLQDVAPTDDDKGPNHEVVASEDTHINEKETGLASINLEEVAELNNDNQKQDEKEQDYNMIPEAKEKSLQETAYADEVKEQHLSVPAADDENTHGNEPYLVSNVDSQKQDEKEKDNSTKAEEIPLQEASSTVETKGVHLVDNNRMKYPRVDDRTQIEKEEGIDINDEAKEKSLQEAASTDVVERQDHLLPAVEDKNTHGNETGLVSSDPEGTDPHRDNTEQQEKEEDKTKAEPVPKEDHADNVEEKNLTIPEAEVEDCNNTKAEAELGSADPLVVGDTLDNQTIEGPEQERTELHSPAESTNFEEKPGEAFDEGRETQPASSSKNLEDHEMQKESSLNENRSETTHHFENQNSRMEEEEGTRNSISDAASSTSHDLVPEEPAVLEPEEHELAKIHTEQLIQLCNGPLKSEDMIIPSSTCQDQENGFILDSSTSSDMVELPDPSLEVEKERDEHLVKELAAKEVNSEKKFELKDGDEVGNDLGNITTIMTDLPNGNGEKCNGELPSDMNSMKNYSPQSQVEAYLADETHNLSVQASKTEENGMVLSQEATMVGKESENANSKYFRFQIQSEEESIEKSNGHGSEEGSSINGQNASPPPFMVNGHQNEEKRCLLDTSCDSKSCNKDCQSEEEIIMESSHLVDVSINYQNEAIVEKQEETQKEVHLVTDPAVISADAFLMDGNYKEEDLNEKKMIEHMVEKMEDSNPIENDKSRSENGGECASPSYPKLEEAFLSPFPFLHVLTENQQQDSHMECKKVQNVSESIAELKLESSGEFSTTDPSSFVTQNMTEKNVVSVLGLNDQKPLRDLSERPKPTSVTMAETNVPLKQSSEQCAIGEIPAIANGDCYQRESVGRSSTESNPDNISIHTQMRKSPSFDLDLRIDARAEESEQTPLLYQDKTTNESFTSQADVSDHGKPVADTEYGKNSLQYEAMPVGDKVVTLERSDSEKSKTPFLGFLKEEEEADQMLITPKKQDNQSAAKKANTKVSTKKITPSPTKGKEKRKPRTSLFGTCMCCATVIN